MSMIATALKHMLAAGMSQDAILEAVAEMEASMPKAPELTARQARNRRYYEKRKERLKASEIKTDETIKTLSDASQKKAPPDPLKENNTPPSHPSDVQTPAGVRRAKGTRLPDDFRIDDDLRAFCRELGFSEAEIDGRLIPEFCDYWRGVPGSKGLKLDWPATFRNRAREVAGRRERQRPPDRQPPRQSAQATFLDIAREAHETLTRSERHERPFDGEILGSDSPEPTARHGRLKIYERPRGETGQLYEEAYPGRVRAFG